MWSVFVNHLPSWTTIIMAVISIVAIAVFYRFNQILHEKGDPPWKKEKRHKDK